MMNRSYLRNIREHIDKEEKESLPGVELEQGLASRVELVVFVLQRVDLQAEGCWRDDVISVAADEVLDIDVFVDSA